MAETVHPRFIGCGACGRMTPIVLPDRGDAPEIAEAYLQDWYCFFSEHARHELIEVACEAGAAATGGKVWDPMAELVFEAGAMADAVQRRSQAIP